MTEKKSQFKPKTKHYNDFIKTLNDLNGKTIAITGTTSGTGFVAAKCLAEKGARVLLLNRKSPRSLSSFERLKKLCPKAHFVEIECDLQSFSSVREASEKIHSLCKEGLYALANNAGVMALRDKATVDGFDIQMQTNHLSHFLLTRKLMPLLEKYSQDHGDARIVNHSSIARLMVKKLEAKYLEKKGGELGGDGRGMMIFVQGRWTRYAQTKLANACFTAALHRKLQEKKSHVKAIVVHPGFALTELQNRAIQDGGMSSWLSKIIARGAQSEEDGAMALIKALASDDVSSGIFIGPGRGKMAAGGPVINFELEKYYDNEETINLLWTKSCDAVSEDFDI